jgi:hypothetical protein
MPDCHLIRVAAIEQVKLSYKEQDITIITAPVLLLEVAILSSLVNTIASSFV